MSVILYGVVSDILSDNTGCHSIVPILSFHYLQLHAAGPAG